MKKLNVNLAIILFFIGGVLVANSPVPKMTRLSVSMLLPATLKRN